MGGILNTDLPLKEYVQHYIIIIFTVYGTVLGSKGFWVFVYLYSVRTRNILLFTLKEAFNLVSRISLFTERQYYLQNTVNVFKFLVPSLQNSEWSAGQFGAAGSVLQSNAVTIPSCHIAAYPAWTTAHPGRNWTVCYVSHSTRCWSKAILHSSSCEDWSTCAGVCNWRKLLRECGIYKRQVHNTEYIHCWE